MSLRLAWIIAILYQKWLNQIHTTTRVAGRSLRDRVRSSVTRQELRVKPLLLHIKRCLGHLFQMLPGSLPGEVFSEHGPLGEGHGEGLGHNGETIVFPLAQERLNTPLALEDVSALRDSGPLCLDFCLSDPTLKQW